jgi:hypothetical protein
MALPRYFQRHLLQEISLACPFFMPTRKLDGGEWPHPARLPLGFGWEGHCTAPGNQGVTPDLQRLHDECSLGYASACPHLPKERAWDAVRFAVLSENESRVLLAYVCERNHLPAEHGSLELKVQERTWAKSHADARVQKMAQCFVEAWLEKGMSRVSRAADGEPIDEQS